jgi:hypothetical protein
MFLTIDIKNKKREREIKTLQDIYIESNWQPQHACNSKSKSPIHPLGIKLQKWLM